MSDKGYGTTIVSCCPGRSSLETAAAPSSMSQGISQLQVSVKAVSGETDHRPVAGILFSQGCVQVRTDVTPWKTLYSTIASPASHLRRLPRKTPPLPRLSGARIAQLAI